MILTAFVIVLGAANIVAFLWFLYEITRLEGWPGRKWHHAYIAVALAALARLVNDAERYALLLYMETGIALPRWMFNDAPWLALILLVLAFFLIIDDAAQHRVHNRLKRAGVSMNQWPVSWLHRKYELLARSIHDDGD